MNKVLYIFPLLLLAFGCYLKYSGDQVYSWVCTVLAILTWLALVGNDLNNDKNNSNV